MAVLLRPKIWCLTGLALVYVSFCNGQQQQQQQQQSEVTDGQQQQNSRQGKLPSILRTGFFQWRDLNNDNNNNNNNNDQSAASSGSQQQNGDSGDAGQEGQSSQQVAEVKPLLASMLKPEEHSYLVSVDNQNSGESNAEGNAIYWMPLPKLPSKQIKRDYYEGAAGRPPIRG